MTETMKKFEGTISIIIPVYQAEKYLYRCLDSILTQSYSRLEVILIDDGSRDRSPQICDEYAKKDSRVKVIHKKNGGAASARNSGIDVATGEYIGFVDSDDWIEKDTYKKIVQVIEQHEPELLLWDYNKINVGNSYQVTQPIREGMYTKEQMYKEYFDHLLMFKEIEFPPTISNWVCLVKEVFWKKII